MSIALISLDHLSQLIPALAALRHANNKKPVLVLTKPHITFNDLKKSHLHALLSVESQFKIIIGNELFYSPKMITYLPVSLRAIILRKKLQTFLISDIYFAHDISSDFWNQTIMQAFPLAKRICFGDAFGIVYTQKYFNRLMYKIVDDRKIIIQNLLARVKRWLNYPSKKKQLFAHHAILAIPSDPGKDFLPQCELSIVDKTTFKQCVLELSNKLIDFKIHMRESLILNSGSCYLLILNNFTESKLTSLEQEINLYREIICTHTTTDDLIIIKPHPAHNPLYFNNIVNSLRKKFLIQTIDKMYYDLPIELAEELIMKCTILSLSYSSISLSYIYEKEVKHVLTQSLINKYFLNKKLAWFIESNQLYLDIIKALCDSTPLL